MVHAEDSRGRVTTSRTHPRLLGLHAKLGPSGEPVVDGLAWRDPAVRRRVVEIVGAGAGLVRDESESRFDEGVELLEQGECEAMGASRSGVAD
jgi:hypothetical protein